MDYLK